MLRSQWLDELKLRVPQIKVGESRAAVCLAIQHRKAIAVTPDGERRLRIWYDNRQVVKRLKHLYLSPAVLPKFQEAHHTVELRRSRSDGFLGYSHHQSPLS